MADSKGNEIVMVGLVLGGLYVLYQLIQGIKKVGSAAAGAAEAAGQAVYQTASTVTAPVTDLIYYAWKTWEWATNPSMMPTGNVILPNGTSVPLASLHVRFNNTYNAAQFAYGGITYVIPANPSGGPAFDTNGDYHAVDWNTYSASLPPASG